jgi:hypothetical protein
VDKLPGNKGDGDGRTVGARLEEPLENCFVEFRVSAAGKKTVDFDYEEQVDVL